MSGIDRIATERKRQIEVEGYTAEHDDQHEWDELINAGISYALLAYQRHPICGWTRDMVITYVLEDFWPWDERELKPEPTLFPKHSQPAIRELEKAGALIAAAIDHLERLEDKNG